MTDPNKMRHLLLAIVCIFLLLSSDAFSAGAKSIPDELRDFLSKEMKLTEDELKQALSERSIAKALDTEEHEQVAIFGLVHINVSQQYFLERLRTSLYLTSMDGVLQNGVFSTPPELSDISALSWEQDDLEQIRDCDPSDCTVRFPGGNAILFQKQINWSSNRAIQQANDLMRRLSVDYVTNYQNKGDDALTSYNIKRKLWSVKEGTHRLLTNSAYLNHRVPQLASYLRNYPREHNADAENIFNWQKVKFGLQPVIRFNHIVILPMKESSQTSYIIGSKMLFANHYFRDALEFRSLIPDQETPESKGFYLLTLSRSHVDGMTGFKGLFVRGRAIKKSVEQLKQGLMKIKLRMEEDFKANPPR